MFEISAISAFKDNYIWVIHTANRQAIVVDPGDAQPVRQFLNKTGLQLAAILVTHHHADHQGGVAELASLADVPVYGPANESITGCTFPLCGGERFTIDGVDFEVIAAPGHTLGHLLYRSELNLFCGDTLFGAGCGRLFEGTPAQMLAAMRYISTLPDETQIYCAHEYTAMNLPFAQAVEPNNPQINARLERVRSKRAAGLPTVPLRLAEEKATNPFLRDREPEVIAAALSQGAVDTSDVAVFAAIRQWRNHF